MSWWPGNVSVGGTHVHHLVWGICAMMIFGYVGVVHQPDSPWREIVTVFFAIGMGLTLDEFALWVDLKDVYWEKEGRKSVDAMIIAGCIAGMFAGRILVVAAAGRRRRWRSLRDRRCGRGDRNHPRPGLRGKGEVLDGPRQPGGVADRRRRSPPSRQATFAVGAALLPRRAADALARALPGRRGGPVPAPPAASDS